MTGTWSILLLVFALLVGQWTAASATAPAQPLGAGETPDLVLPVLAAVASGGISLHTHQVDLALTPGDGLALAVALRASYRLQNDGSETSAITLQLPASAPAVILTVGDAPLTPVAGADGMMTVTITVVPDQPVELVLAYDAVIEDRRLPLIRYPAGILDQWLGQVSLRMDIRPAASMPPASWLSVAPEDWAYAPPGVSPDPAIQWLYDGNPPDEIVFQAVHPAVWQQMQAAEQAAAPGAPLTAFAESGALYTVLAQASISEGNAQAGERFYAQAVAAYSSGIRQGEAAATSAVELAPLHAGLAALYRGRVVGADGASNPLYAELMTGEASNALQGLIAGDGRRTELERWQAEGLRLLLTDARRRGDVAGALAVIDRLANSSAGANAADFLAAEREALLVQQALELLDRGDRAAALALAGDAIADPALQAPDELRSLFSAWAASAAMSEGGIALSIDAFPHPDRVEAAQSALQEVVDGWRTGQGTRDVNVSLEESTANDAPTLRLRLQLPSGTTGVALAEGLPASADWALLRSLLGQLGPKLDSSSEGLRQQVHVSQPVDLRSAGQQWGMMAQTLSEQSAGLEAQASSTAQGEAVTLEASLNARIQAANYRDAAAVWRDLARDSFVELSLAVTGSLGNSTRTWLVTVDSPPQMLDVQVDSLNTGRTALAAAGLGLGLLMLAVMLWRLLV